MNKPDYNSRFLEWQKSKKKNYLAEALHDYEIRSRSIIRSIKSSQLIVNIATTTKMLTSHALSLDPNSFDELDPETYLIFGEDDN